MWSRRGTLFLITLMLLINESALSQTCCSGGVPLSSNIGLPGTEKGSWQFLLTYDFNQLTTLKDGNKELDDGIRERITQSILYQTGYTFNDRFSFDLTLSFVRQERNIFSLYGTNSVITNGVGDGVLLFKYQLLPNKPMTTVYLGVGPKIPFGATDRTRENGISLPADLQPGSGAWDAIFWGTISQSMVFRRSMSVYVTSTYRATGVNPDYLGSIEYEFGNDLQILAGVADRIAVGRSIWDPTLSLRYRKAQRDIINTAELAGTGGEWVFIIPALRYSFSAEFSLSALIELPLYSFVNETQVTPTKRIAIGVYYRINGKKL